MPTPYLALYTTTPTMPAATGGVEVSGGSYARVSLAGLMGAPSGGSIDNSSLITFPMATADWGTIEGLGICDAATAGNILEAAPLGNPNAVITGDTFQIPIGYLLDLFS